MATLPRKLRTVLLFLTVLTLSCLCTLAAFYIYRCSLDEHAPTPTTTPPPTPEPVEPISASRVARLLAYKARLQSAVGSSYLRIGITVTVVLVFTTLAVVASVLCFVSSESSFAVSPHPPAAVDPDDPSLHPHKPPPDEQVIEVDASPITMYRVWLLVASVLVAVVGLALTTAMIYTCMFKKAPGGGTEPDQPDLGGAHLIAPLEGSAGDTDFKPPQTHPDPPTASTQTKVDPQPKVRPEPQEMDPQKYAQTIDVFFGEISVYATKEDSKDFGKLKADYLLALNFSLPRLKCSESNYVEYYVNGNPRQMLLPPQFNLLLHACAVASNKTKPADKYILVRKTLKGNLSTSLEHDDNLQYHLIPFSEFETDSAYDKIRLPWMNIVMSAKSVVELDPYLNNVPSKPM